MKRYNPKDLEPKWQKIWANQQTFQVREDPSKPKKYIIDMFPYPSGSAMHVGHVRNFTISDVLSQYHRQKGYNVMHAMGWDTFGLPAENYAIKTGTPPAESTKTNIANFKSQLQRLGMSYDWSREINTSDPEYYKWTQWIFTKLFEDELAYQKESAQWWCPVDKTVLANEQVENGRCWRCGNEVIKKSLNQWFFKITDYAEQLLDGIDDLDWPEKIKTMQRNWIGKSKGAEVEFPLNENLMNSDFVFLHGYGWDHTGAFWPWLKGKVEEAGGTVYAPDLPNPNEPNIDEQVDLVLSSHEFTENTVVVTHSLGGVVAMKLIPKLHTKINSLIMVAPPLKPSFRDNKERPLIANACDWSFDFEAIKNGAQNITVLREENDHIIPPDHPKVIATKLNATLVNGIGKETHFDGKIEPSVAKQVFSTIRIFTTRPDTLFGATFMVLAPEHPLVNKIATDSQKKEVEKYVKAAQKKSEIERQENKEKTGVFTGAYAINPANQAKIPVWIADYVLMGYGTGAIMAVPGHDERDHEFARKFDLPVIEVIQKPQDFESCYTGEGEVINSGRYNGVSSAAMREKVVEDLSQENLAEEKVNYKIRDWLISRQRYWGVPIPIIHCEKDGAVAVPETQLPVKLPEVKSYEPTGEGSALASVDEWVNTACPKCGGPAKRETDTMDGYACSSWYFLRYADPHNNTQAWDPEKVNYWLPIDYYCGGDHAVSHLLYSRFWMHFFADQGWIEKSRREPVGKLVYNGYILAHDGNKMSKSKGNVINPDDLIKQGYGADAVRVFEMFIAPYELNTNWNTNGVPGTYRFLNRTWTLVQEYLETEKTGSESSPEILRIIHRAIKKVSGDLDNLSFNTAVAALMETVNDLFKIKARDNYQSKEWEFALKALVQLVAPFAPHLAEELWQDLGQGNSVHTNPWPVHEEKYLVSDTITIVVQVNGKVRANLQVPATAGEETIVEAAIADENVASYLEKGIKKTIYVPNKLVNFVV